MLIEGNALKIRTIRSILVKSGDIGQNFRTLSFSERCFDTQTKIIMKSGNERRVMKKLLPQKMSKIEEIQIVGTNKLVRIIFQDEASFWTHQNA